MSRQFRELDPNSEVRKKLQLAKQGSNNPNYGKPRDPETVAKISQSMKDYWATIPSRNNVNNNSNTEQQ